MTWEEMQHYQHAIREYGELEDHAEAVWGFLGAMGALSDEYTLEERLKVAVNVLNIAFEYEREFGS